MRVYFKEKPPKVESHRCKVFVKGRYWDTRWRWECECGAKGHWQGQSPEASVFKWFRHAYKAVGWPWDGNVAYDWLRSIRG